MFYHAMFLLLILLSLLLSLFIATNQTSVETSIPNLSIVVHSFDGYKRYWPGWHHFFHKHCPKPFCPIYFCTEVESVEQPHDSMYHHIATGKGEWGARLITALRQISTPYVLYMQEDMWLTSPLSTAYMQSAMNQMETRQLNHLKLQKDCQHQVGLSDQYNNPAWYIMSHQPGLWKVDFLLSTLMDQQSPFAHETTTNRMLQQAPDLAATCACNQQFTSQVFPYEDVSRQGQLRPVGKEMMEKERLSFIVGSDEVMFRKAR